MSVNAAWKKFCGVMREWAYWKEPAQEQMNQR